MCTCNWGLPGVSGVEFKHTVHICIFFSVKTPFLVSPGSKVCISSVHSSPISSSGCMKARFGCRERRVKLLYTKSRVGVSWVLPLTELWALPSHTDVAQQSLNGSHSYIPRDCATVQHSDSTSLVSLVLGRCSTRGMVNLKQTKAAHVFLGGADQEQALSPSGVPSFNEGWKLFGPLLKFHHNHPRSRLSVCEPLWRELFGKQPAGLPADWIQLHQHGSRNAPGLAGPVLTGFPKAPPTGASARISTSLTKSISLGDPGLLKVEQLLPGKTSEGINPPLGSRPGDREK